MFGECEMKNCDSSECCTYGCNQGRNCPARTTNTAEVDILRAAQYVAGVVFAVCVAGFFVWVLK
jgi:hypothetical protein